jgi:hypothetical protein
MMRNGEINECFVSNYLHPVECRTPEEVTDILRALKNHNASEAEKHPC